VERGGATLILGGGEKKEKGWVSPVTMEVVEDAGRLGVSTELGDADASRCGVMASMRW
jgi:hypothetical protein